MVPKSLEKVWNSRTSYSMRFMGEKNVRLYMDYIIYIIFKKKISAAR